MHPRHRALLDGSKYRDRSVMDTASKRVARAEKAEKQREREGGAQEKRTEETVAEDKK